MEGTSLWDTAATIKVRSAALDDRTCLVELSGDVDLASAPALKVALGQLLDRHSSCDFVLDLAHIAHLDSTGLAVLIGFRRRLGGHGRVVLARAPQQVVSLLKITGLDGTFAALPDVEQARAYLRQTGGSDRQATLSPDAAMVVGLAATALPFTDSLAAEADTWARIFVAFSCVGEDNFQATEAPPAHAQATPQESRAGAGQDGQLKRIDTIVAHATRLAALRGNCIVRADDLVRAAMATYGVTFEGALHAHATNQTASFSEPFVGA